MTTLTPQQKRALNAIKVFQAEYLEGVPYNILKLDLDIPEEDLNQILGYLEEENYISRDNGIILLEKNFGVNQKDEDVPEGTQLTEPEKLTEPEETIEETDEEINDNIIVDVNNEDEIEVENPLSETEQKSLEIIRKLVDDEGNLSRTLLEGNLLYGELELSNIRMYNLVTSLENKGILKKIQLSDGEYYKFTP